MKTPENIIGDITARLTRTWSQTAAGDVAAWPHTFTIGAPSKADLERVFREYQAAALAWRRWHSEHAALGVELGETTRRVHGTQQPIPTHISVFDVDTAATLAGTDWIARLTRARERVETLYARFPAPPDIARLLRQVDTWTDVDFALLCDAAAWFTVNDGAGLTPRQVPIAGMHAKWLNTRRHLVAALAGREFLPLAAPHPPRVHLTYLDPEHRTTGGRRHDCISVGDTVTLPYRPVVVIISENKDTAVAFPPVPRGVAVEGGGFGGNAAAALDWLTTASILVYWGDIDAAGFEILDGFRAAGVNASSILMDMATFQTYEQFGTDFDRHGNLIQPTDRRDLPHLTNDERTMYEALTDRRWTRHRRLEQERIPLADALRSLSELRATESVLGCS